MKVNLARLHDGNPEAVRVKREREIVQISRFFNTKEEEDRMLRGICLPQRHMLPSTPRLRKVISD